MYLKRAKSENKILYFVIAEIMNYYMNYLNMKLITDFIQLIT